MKNCKNLTTSEVQMILNGATIFVEPLKEQPRYGVKSIGNSFYPENLYGAAITSMRIDIPYQPGQTIYGRETWHNEADYWETERPIYKAANRDWVMNSGGKWLSPATMPKSAARIFLHITGVTVKRCNEVTEGDASEMGIDRSLAHRFNIACGESKWDIPFRSVYRALYIDRFGAESWERGDYIWLVSFNRVEKP